TGRTAAYQSGPRRGVNQPTGYQRSEQRCGADVTGKVHGRLARVAALVPVTGCAPSPTARKQLRLCPEGQTTTRGAQPSEETQRPTEREADAAIVDYVQCVGDALTGLSEVRDEHEDWEIVVFADDAVNAFAVPGGKIGVYRGLLG